MCQIIIFNETEIDTAIKLFHFLESECQTDCVVTLNGSSNSFNFDCCLCPFDLPATLTKSGIKFNEKEGFSEFIITESKTKKI